MKFGKFEIEPETLIIVVLLLGAFTTLVILVTKVVAH
jgi:hypothetical protein